MTKHYHESPKDVETRPTTEVSSLERAKEFGFVMVDNTGMKTKVKNMKF